MLNDLYYCAKFGGTRISPAVEVSKNVEFFCLFVNLFVTLLNDHDGVSAYDFAMKLLEYRNVFHTAG